MRAGEEGARFLDATLCVDYPVHIDEELCQFDPYIRLKVFSPLGAAICAACVRVPVQ